ncbi:HNH endonuclease [Mycobacterium phage Finemlucis]|uniref:HNH endonuclease n=1 Tax=Mycobacterium phage Finemlucis TaxID=2015844 RepID=A0A291IA02_9CAUD|nr:HNH endonuclease [Mycobacterium phage Finemlucis]ATG86518.1 hypothetical protein SEA_FINEMLUCIS_109 [Mycobacterium phage Finemlucis]
MKRCGKCGDDKPLSEFNRNRAKSDGYQSRCRSCQRSGERSHYASNESRKERLRFSKFRARAAARACLYKFLGEHPCVDCGESDRVVLDLDHVRGVKEHDVSHMVARGFSVPKIEAEVAKCEVRCANCHRRVTAKRSGDWYRATGILDHSPLGKILTSSRDYPASRRAAPRLVHRLNGRRQCGNVVSRLGAVSPYSPHSEGARLVVQRIPNPQVAGSTPVLVAFD